MKNSKTHEKSDEDDNSNAIIISLSIVIPFAFASLAGLTYYCCSHEQSAPSIDGAPFIY